MKRIIGKVTHYYGKIGVAVVRLTGALRLGDLVKFRSGKREVEEAVVEIQVDRKDVPAAGAGTEVCVKVHDPVEPGEDITKLV
jgi:hypothetical protein